MELNEPMELIYGTAPTTGEYRVGVDAASWPLLVRSFLEDGRTMWRFSHVCTLPRSGKTLRVAPLLQVGAGHQILSTEPLHIEPSILCEDCGIHGYVRDGSWVSA